ncbi:jacalin-like lectin [Dolichospermum flos-aquae]|uniref:ETX/MTX2 family pore-forming toxin n=1 Tax=Dolichospermum flos-aquae LEGE 04289 TaxID=1828708 RepID=A0ACC5PXE8_DOLFA|nr:ETX/MTX2 family pore-forming toxin [Dolichospermum flos-aquae]MBE9217431.1 ETX/MTX2 family pore-forming toxin [Dolichospermum flos-aquae LEGE 04289]
MSQFITESIPTEEPTAEMAKAAIEEIFDLELEEQVEAKSTQLGLAAFSPRRAAFSSRNVVEGNILAKHYGQYTHYRIGGQGGHFFSDAKYDQSIAVSGLEVWADTWTLRGIRITFSDNSVVMRGAAEGTYCGSISLDYVNGETVTELSIWGNGAGSRCGAFRIKTSKNKIFFPQMTKWGLKTEYKMNVGSGVILGVIGDAGSDIDSLGFLMLDKVDNTVLTAFQYDLTKVALPQNKYVYDIEIPNPSNTDSDSGSIVKQVSIEKGGEWSIKAGFTFGQEYKVSGGVPFVGEGEMTTKWEVSFETSYTRKWNETKTETVTIPLIVPAKTKTRIEYSHFQGKIDACPFTATMRYYLVGGGTWNCQLSGFYDGVDTTRIFGTSCVMANWDEKLNKWIYVKQPSPKTIYSGIS